MLLPSPMPASSLGLTVCRVPPGTFGSTVSAKSVLRVLAGGSLRCASCAASTSPLSASATIHDSADRSAGTLGAPVRGRTCVPCRCSDDCCPGEAVARVASGSTPGSAAAPGARASIPITQTAEQEAAAREENPMVMASR